ncbi:MAG TPA: ribosomal protein S18-alanine N-acetyltransferase [Oscillatoriaceae cyanobacterium M33_DOE_052]|uniref:Ribosomal-protein-alanine N-acetyltransferase n=1 Tax=Planktothricoides sp. SpSt-374 TaxID=2282167 RepID=A0A7C3VFG8_9CYAN|nr:ribosomal protein S18-alanine N-acetyltransferase [Oscillatoriaceae cyanobacterium M33_DOE_052]
MAEIELSPETAKVLEIKPLTTDLLPAAVELDRLCLGGMWTLNGYEREHTSPNSDLLAISVPNPNGPHLVGIGCLWAILEEAHITLIAVHPQYQGQGFGQALLYHLLHRARLRQLEWATLEVRTTNQPAISLYQKFGFQEVGRRRRYYADTGEDALILWRSGLHQPEFPLTLAAWEQEISSRLQASGWLFISQ